MTQFCLIAPSFRQDTTLQPVSARSSKPGHGYLDEMAFGVQLGRLGSDGGGDEDGIGGLETKKEATARLEPVGRRRAVRPDPGDGMQTF